MAMSPKVLKVRVREAINQKISDCEAKFNELLTQAYTDLAIVSDTPTTVTIGVSIDMNWNKRIIMNVIENFKAQGWQVKVAGESPTYVTLEFTG